MESGIVVTIRELKIRTYSPKTIKETSTQSIIAKKKNDYVFASEQGGKLSTRTAQKNFLMPWKRQGSKRMLLFTLSDIALQLTFLRTVLIYVMYKNYLDIKILERLKYIHRLQILSSKTSKAL